MRSWPFRGWVASLGFWLVVVWLVASVWTVLQARSAATQAQSTLTTLAEVDPTTADIDAVRSDLGTARASLERAHGLLARKYLEPWRLVPVLGRQLTATRGLVYTADAVVAHSDDAATAAAAVVDARAEERVTELAGLETALLGLKEVLADYDLGPTQAIVSPLASAQAEARSKLGELTPRVDEAYTVIKGLRIFAENGRYLMIGANVNEMQAGSGMPLTIGSLEIDRGAFLVSEFVTLDEVPVETAIAPVDPDVAENWGFLVPGNDFRKLALTPRYDAYSGPMALALWNEVRGEVMDGALTIDPVALAALLEVVGPVEVDGQEFRTDNVLNYMLTEQYNYFEDPSLVSDYDDFAALSDSRSDLLSSIAGAAFAKFADGDWDPFELLDSMRPVADGRHLLAYSSNPDVQAMWDQVGVSGALSGDEISVGVMNLGANKLDPYLDIRVEATTEPADDGGHRISLEISLTNRVPDGLINYVIGPWEAIGFQERGGYLGRLFIEAPGTVTKMQFVGAGPDLEVYGRDGANTVMVGRFGVERGASATFDATIDLAPGLDSLTLLPSAHVPAVDWLFDGVDTNDASHQTLRLNP